MHFSNTDQKRVFYPGFRQGIKMNINLSLCHHHGGEADVQEGVGGQENN